MALYEYNVNERNVHENDSRIRFQDEGHLYYIDDVPPNRIVSVTSLISRYFGEFPLTMCANRMIHGKRWWDDPNYDYYLLKIDEIIKKMQSKGRVATQAGSDLHRDIEYYYIRKPFTNSSPEYGYFINFINDHDYLEPIRSEWMIFHKLALIAGSIDMLYLNKRTGNYIIADWKRAKKIDKKGYKYGTYPLDKIQECNYWKYTMQLNTYAYILETQYNITIEDLWIVHLHPTQTNYVLHKLPNVRELVHKLFQSRVTEIIRYQKPCTDLHHELYAKYLENTQNKE